MAISTRAEEIIDRIGGIREEIVRAGKNSHGTYVLVGCAVLSDLLRRCSQGKFSDQSHRLSDRLFDGALSSFSARIDLARALRIIDENAASRMHQLRSLRNEFAHTAVVSSLDTAGPAEIYDKLGLPRDDDGERLPRHITALVAELGRPLEAALALDNAEANTPAA